MIRKIAMGCVSLLIGAFVAFASISWALSHVAVWTNGDSVSLRLFGHEWVHFVEIPESAD